MDSSGNILENKNGKLLPNYVHDEDGDQQLLRLIACPRSIIKNLF
jgi:hypothetical protein